MNKQRRTFLTVGLTGVGAFIFGKLFGDDIYRMFGGSSSDQITKLGDFTITQNKEEMIFADDSGEAIFIVDKKSFK